MISSKELIEEARRQGYKIELRTLREYVNRGLLPKPIAQKRQQEKGQGGGMIAFYPDKSKKMLVAIVESRNKGVGLEEIKKKLYDEEASEFFQIFSAIDMTAGTFVIRDFGLMEMNRSGERKITPFGSAFQKYLDDGIMPIDFIYEIAKSRSSNTVYSVLDEKPEDLYAIGLSEDFERLRTLFMTIYGWDGEDKERYLITFAIKYLRESFLVQFNNFVSVNKLTRQLDKHSLNTKAGNLLLEHIQMSSNELETLWIGVENLEKILRLSEGGNEDAL